MLSVFNQPVAVKESDLITITGMMEYQRDTAIEMAKMAVKYQNISIYFDMKSIYNRAVKLLELDALKSMARKSSEAFPDYNDEKQPFFDDATIDWLYSDGKPVAISDSVDVPF